MRLPEALVNNILLLHLSLKPFAGPFQDLDFAASYRFMRRLQLLQQRLGLLTRRLGMKRISFGIHKFPWASILVALQIILHNQVYSAREYLGFGDG